MKIKSAQVATGGRASPVKQATQPLRLAFVIPWRDRGRWLWEYLPEGIVGELLFAAPEPGAGGRHLPPYLGELLHLARRRYDWNQYDVVFTWELRTTVATALLRRLTGQRKARFVPVGPILKGPVLRALPVFRWLLRDADQIICFSRAECDENAVLLRLPRDHFVFLPTPWLADEAKSEQDAGFVLALGQSNRDYATLLRAAEGTNIPITIVAGNPSAIGGVKPPSNVTVRYNTGQQETNDLIAQATLHCIPLHPMGYSAGQTVLLRAMARGKAVIVSETPGVRDYVRDGETAVFVPPGNAYALRKALLYLWSDSAERQRIGSNAANAVRREFGFAQFTTALVNLVTEHRMRDQ